MARFPTRKGGGGFTTTAPDRDVGALPGTRPGMSREATLFPPVRTLPGAPQGFSNPVYTPPPPPQFGDFLRSLQQRSQAPAPSPVPTPPAIPAGAGGPDRQAKLAALAALIQQFQAGMGGF